MVTIINYGMSNIRSIFKKFQRMNIPCKISSNKDDIKSAEKLILPGVGHFENGMKNLSNLGLIPVLNHKVIYENTPILGICLGAQLFCKHSEEGNVNGLRWIDAKVVRFDISDRIRYKVPHIGWNTVNIVNSNKLDSVISKKNEFYFIHSYHLKSNNKNNIWMKSKYEYEFVSAIHRDNIYGTQFHPEKSHEIGYKLLKKFAEL